MSLTALFGSAALVVGMSVPANAVFAPPDPVRAVPQPPAPQSLTVAPTAPGSIPLRDGFEVLSAVEVLRLKYSGVDYGYPTRSGDVRWPFVGDVPITDGFGAPRDGGTHRGIDFAPAAGTPIYAIADGTVVFSAADESGYGNHVIIRHDLSGVAVRSHYAHLMLESSPLRVADHVGVGELVGLVGDTGTATGAHLHLEILIDGVPVDPYAWLGANAVY